MREAIDHYNELLSRDFYLNSAVELLQQNADRLSVAGRPTCNVLRPCFIPEKTYRFIQRASTLFMQAISILSSNLLSTPELRSKLDLTEEEEAIVKIDSGYGAPDVSARLDGFLAPDGGFHFVEYNADSPGGIGYGGAWSDVFAQMPVLKAFGERHPWRTIPVKSLTFAALLSAYRRWGGREFPNIAIIDWDGAATYNEFLVFLKFFAEHGCAVKIGSPDDLEYKDGRLWMGDFRIDLLYKRVIVGEFISKYGLNHPIVEAVRDHAVCMVNGFRVQMLFKKTLFSLLSDPKYSSIFPVTLVESMAKHLPWTRKVSETKSTHNGLEIDLIDFIRKNRERLVLKPNGEYGGKGVLLGWECSEMQWEEAIGDALRTSYVVQQRVPVGSENYPSLVDGQLRFEERYFDLDPYVWDGTKTEGCGVRLSRLALLNVSAGGGSAAPLFILT